MQNLALLVCLACCFLPTHAEPDGTAHQIVFALECCDVLQQIHKFFVDKPTDRISLEACRQHPRECQSYTLMKTFVRHTRLMLDPQRKLLDNGVTTTDSSMLFTLSNHTLDVASMSIFAFMGRSVATDASMLDATKWMSYDMHNDKFYLEDSACELNRDVYTTLLLASIVILVFFIGVQVQRDEAERRKEEEAASAVTQAAAGGQPATGKPGTREANAQLVFRNLIRA